MILGGAGPLVDRFERAGVGVQVQPMPGRLLERKWMGVRQMLDPARLLSGLAYVHRLAGQLRASRPRLLHVNSLRACVAGSLAARRAGVPSVWQIHSVVAPPLIAPAGVRLLRTLARHLPAYVIFNSRATAACFNLAPERWSVIPCGVDAAAFAPDGERSPKPLRVGMIGRIAPLKGQHVFLDAVGRLSHRHPGAEFVIAGTALFGEAAYDREVHEQAKASEARDRIRFLGFVDDVPALLRDLDIVVHASVQPEGFGQVVAEAMMAGKPVIASALGGPVDMVEDRVTGRLLAPGDAEALARTLDEMLADPATAATMGRRGRERALRLYDLHETARAIENVYDRVLQ